MRRMNRRTNKKKENWELSYGISGKNKNTYLYIYMCKNNIRNIKYESSGENVVTNNNDGGVVEYVRKTYLYLNM